MVWSVNIECTQFIFTGTPVKSSLSAVFMLLYFFNYLISVLTDLTHQDSFHKKATVPE